MFTETLKEVLVPFNTKEVEYFEEATKNCSPERKLAVAKRMREAELPSGFQFTEAQIRRFVAQDGLSKVNWFPSTIINEATASVGDSGSKLTELKERQFKAYRASGMSEAEASKASGFKPTAA